ncbi:ROK family protein [bacterium]|nr:ROK family protein [bacterium]
MNKQPPLALGIDLGGSSIKWGVVQPDGTILQDGRVPLPDRKPGTVADALARVVETATGSGETTLVAVGIGSPGLIDKTRRIVRTSPNFPGWQDEPLAGMVEELIGSKIPVVLENDANLLVYSETRWGGAVGLKNVVVLTLGTGVGGGVLVDGHPVRGSGGGGAELGHIPIDIHGPRCGCGATGCFEVFCNITGTMREASSVYGVAKSPVDPEALAEAARQGDDRAIETWKRVGQYLGAGVAGLINIFNPEAVLVGGGLANAGDFLFEPARETAKARCYAPNWAETFFGQAKLKERSGLLGAAALAFERVGVETASSLHSE